MLLCQSFYPAQQDSCNRLIKPHHTRHPIAHHKAPVTADPECPMPPITVHRNYS